MRTAGSIVSTVNKPEGRVPTSNDGLEREFKFFNWLDGGVCTTCAPADQEKSIDGKFEQSV
jgi:hypothetical protein